MAAVILSVILSGEFRTDTRLIRPILYDDGTLSGASDGRVGFNDETGSSYTSAIDDSPDALADAIRI